VARAPEGSGVEPLRFVSVGKTIPGHEVRIVDERGGAPERREGQLLSRAVGDEGLLPQPGGDRSDNAPERLPDSGDRAFVAEGEVFITGRAKDLIIKAGGT
jgi:acyl-CoA synthetase (AMP-forming)/AMP-acid ligase II